MDTAPPPDPPSRGRRLSTSRVRATSWLTARRLAPAAAAALLLGAGIAGCGSSAHVAAAGIQSGCQQAAAVLSDGPDPDADPVGYAEAQILQLRTVHPSQASLQRTIDELASAYRAYASTDGANAADKQAAERAVKAMNTACPNAGASL
jgi:hypothetical protein